GPAAMARAIELGKLAGARIALSLSDSFCVERHESAFTTLASGDADIIIGNEAEMLALFGVNTYSDAIAAAGKNGRLFVMTRSGEGSVIIHGQEVVIQPADQIDNLIDTTGAGDAYVAGFLYGFTHGMTLSESALLGTRSASLAIQQVGARPLPADLRHLL
ncbi:MAG: PfkB family carbohydrate kinase, partial [Pseudomonadota bacterium]